MASMRRTPISGPASSSAADPLRFLKVRHLIATSGFVNSTAHDVYGDGIILFRDADSTIRTSAAWQTGMQPTQDIGTPNAIWTWTCARCTVEDNEAFVTDSPGVDGGAYDIDWDNTGNTVLRNYAHDTQGYCIAVFAAGYVTANSEVRGNLCIDNALSPRLAALQGAVYVHTWNGGVVRGLRMEQNTIQWNPRVPGAAAIVSDAQIDGPPAVFSQNLVESDSAPIYRVNKQWAASRNIYATSGEPVFTFGDQHDVTLSDLQSAGSETGSSLQPSAVSPHEAALQIDAAIDPTLDSDGLLLPAPRAQLVVLRSLAGQYNAHRLQITVHFPPASQNDAVANALQDLESVYPGRIAFRARRSYRRSGVSRWHHSSRIRRRTAAGRVARVSECRNPWRRRTQAARAARLLSHAKTRGAWRSAMMSNPFTEVHRIGTARRFRSIALCAALIAAACAALAQNEPPPPALRLLSRSITTGRRTTSSPTTFRSPKRWRCASSTSCSA